MAVHNFTMPRKNQAPQKPQSNERYRKKARMVRIRERLAVQGDLLAEKLAKDLTEVANDALRALLEQHGFWPPPEAK